MGYLVCSSVFKVGKLQTLQVLWVLTPKGPLVPMGDKPILGYVVWSHTIFWFFETSYEDASQNKLHVRANFMILGATVQKLWEFEVFRWTLGRAGMCWNQPARVDYLRKKWRATQKIIKKKRGRPTLSRHWLAASRVVLSDVLGGKDVVEGRDGRTVGFVY
jgi:hypothetical protein